MKWSGSFINAELAFFGFLFSLLSFLLFWSFGRFLFYALLGVLRFGHGRVFKVQGPVIFRANAITTFLIFG